VAVGSERQLPRFRRAIGAAELTEDARFATNGARVANRETLRSLIAALLATAPSATWLERPAATDVTAGPIGCGAVAGSRSGGWASLPDGSSCTLAAISAPRTPRDLPELRHPQRRRRELLL